MALPSASPRVKPLRIVNCEHSPLFKSYIFSFLSSLGNGERHRFRHWCKGVIPRAKLEVDVANDGDVLKLIELLQDANVLSFTDMSFLEQFLSSIRRHDLMEQLKLAELRIAVDVVLEAFSRATSLSEDVCDLSLHGDIITFLVATRERSHELISQVVGELKQADSALEIVGILGEVLEECQQWSTVTALLAIVGELFPTISDSEKQVYVTVFAGLIHKLGGLVSICKRFCGWS